MAAGLRPDLREGLQWRAVALHVLAARAAEVAQRERDLRLSDQFAGHFLEAVERRRPVGEHRAERAWLHLLEAQCEHAVRAGGNRLPREIERGRTGRAVVIDVDDRDAGETHFVERALPCGRVAVDIADEGLLHCRVLDPGIRERQPRGLGAHLEIRRVVARLAERDHADPGDDDLFGHGVTPTASAR